MSSISLLQNLVESLQCLPGVGKKSAQRMAYYLLDKNRTGAIKLSEVLHQSMINIGNCSSCRDYTENKLCSICQSDKRNSQLLCIVESPADIAAIESTAVYSGKYFVLMGSLSPLDGIGPEEIGLNDLLEKIKQEEATEIIIATSATVEGEATAHYIKSMLTNFEKPVKVNRLAQGVPLGGELEYLDSSTLSLSFANRQSI